MDDEPVRIPITDVFDLHSVPDGDVKGVVEEYLREARALGLRHVRIIHGRGIGVRREMIRAILARTDFVESYRDAPAEAGGWGATLARMFHTISVPTRDVPVSTSLRSAGVLDVLSSTPPVADRRAPRIHGHLPRLTTKLR